ncbi:hypothetical protein R1flu_016382 [Riccia fluitans]|uniref:Uncharacterized protein n=1 Tax=Riccia fluitans TaxID=41844 RepID=A0ABD1YLP3_9MARC
MLVELLFTSVVVLTSVYMCNMINTQGPEYYFGYRRLDSEDYNDSSSESEFHAYQLGSAEVSPRSSRWSSTTFSSDDSDADEREENLISTDSPTAELDYTLVGPSLPNGNQELVDGTITSAESDISETEIEYMDLDSPVNHRLDLDPKHTADLDEIPWIVNPLFQESTVN